jgi:type I restriction enzyme M protein
MLDTDTKRRIDTARDILVGKVPDPKSQVEQITIALIYKFMDDMDAESEELGGKRKFFTGDFARFGWAKLMRSGLGGHELLSIYVDGITKMPENPGIPLLFRDIFKNAYLPYRDPETLKSFLKIIDEFTYDHSERLGDAFEYLLSVLGSQGDAGQFRTPRHIIDFIVEVIDPKKTETVLDPACGTAGFLISSYKHILRANTDAKGRLTLTPDERGRLAKNFRGYDISPDMVRLSLVNLYLHGFTDPHIDEYDTLTSEEKWNETADVILANPPFMSPKGGIKPHRRFSVESKRSEVLFVDYMAEHLTPTGRAGIIVPEGVIFQSQTTYTALRKMLVQNSLVAVVSLPAGVFNPYSGVKTSILILDKSIAKQSETIAFFKVENDGFGLGAQRRAIGGSDLPQVKAELHAYLHAVRSYQPTDELRSRLCLIVEKSNIAASGDYNLSGDRYLEGIVTTATWPLVPLGQVTKRISGGTPSKENRSYWNGSIPWVSPKDMKVPLLRDTEDHISEAAIQESATSLVPEGTLLCVVRSGILKHTLPLALTGRAMCFNQDIIALTPTDGKIDARFLYSILKGRSEEILEKGIKPGVTVQSFHNGYFNEFKIPLPPLEVQKQIVAEIEGYQKVSDGARAVLDNYRPHIPIHPDWPLAQLADVIKLSSGKGLTQGQMKEGPYFVYGGNGKNGMHSEYFIEDPNVVIGRVGAYCGAVHLTPPKAWVTDNALYVTEYKAEIDRKYLAQALVQLELNQFAKVGGQPSISQSTVYERTIPFPPLRIQQQIVAEIEAEQALVAANSELIGRFEKKIQATIARVWGKDEKPSVEA